MKRKLSELLNDLELLNKKWQEVYETMDDGDEKEELLTIIGLGIDCIGASLMYGDYENDTGKPYDYYAD
jgi:hypothetical protein